jgi:hypothetical protein
VGWRNPSVSRTDTRGSGQRDCQRRPCRDFSSASASIRCGRRQAPVCETPRTCCLTRSVSISCTRIVPRSGPGQWQGGLRTHPPAQVRHTRGSRGPRQHHWNPSSRGLIAWPAPASHVDIHAPSRPSSCPLRDAGLPRPRSRPGSRDGSRPGSRVGDAIGPTVTRTARRCACEMRSDSESWCRVADGAADPSQPGRPLARARRPVRAAASSWPGHDTELRVTTRSAAVAAQWQGTSPVPCRPPATLV